MEPKLVSKVMAVGFELLAASRGVVSNDACGNEKSLLKTQSLGEIFEGFFAPNVR
jgi:hypothetical protein